LATLWVIRAGGTGHRKSQEAPDELEVQKEVRKMLDSVKFMICTLLGLVYAAAKSFAMIVLPAVFFASGATAMLMYILK